MKNIDPKSLIIGVLATALVFACTDSNKKNSASPSLVTEAKAATSKDDRGKWDNEQEWIYMNELEAVHLGVRSKNQGVATVGYKYTIKGGWEPFATYGTHPSHVLYRKRIK